MTSSDARVKAVPDGWAPALTSWGRAMALADRSRQTIALRRSHVAQLARAVGGEPGTVDADAVLGWLQGRDWSRETRRSWRASLRAWFQFVGRDDLVAALPRVRAAEPTPRPTPDDALALALTGADERVRLILRLAAEAGMRRGEIAQVHVDDLGEDLLGPTLLVHGKGDRARTVPVSAGLAAAVRLRAGRAGWLFPGAIDGHVSAKWVGTLASRALPPPWTLHTLRHRFATRAHDASADLVAVSRLLGHASVATTQRYVATDAARLRRVAEAAA